MTSSASTAQSEIEYAVVVNGEGHHSIWRTNRPIPGGWSPLGFQGSKEACLAHVAEVWTDMRPLSVRESTTGPLPRGRTR
ncbi:MbtH family NRPS accessory protein [Streptomyces sp. NPDC051639]|uniref:MbtH family protein n=1 Tax=unclassified Streptomyces TaxID=2593676 RepID=UPI002E35A688|nr:MbtH family NRPS accessory protein [Streptomyces sp. NBC_01717]